MATEIKTALYLIMIPLFMYTKISVEAVIILAALLTIDFITAIIREVKTNPQGITSSEMKAGFASKVLVILIPFVIAFAGKGVGIDLGALANVTLSVFILSEGYSIIGNIQQIRAKDKTVSEYDAITILLKKLQDIIRYILEDSLKKIGETLTKR